MAMDIGLRETPTEGDVIRALPAIGVAFVKAPAPGTSPALDDAVRAARSRAIAARYQWLVPPREGAGDETDTEWSPAPPAPRGAPHPDFLVGVGAVLELRRGQYMGTPAPLMPAVGGTVSPVNPLDEFQDMLAGDGLLPSVDEFLSPAALPEPPIGGIGGPVSIPEQAVTPLAAPPVPSDPVGAPAAPGLMPPAGTPFATPSAAATPGALTPLTPFGTPAASALAPPATAPTPSLMQTPSVVPPAAAPVAAPVGPPVYVPAQPIPPAPKPKKVDPAAEPSKHVATLLDQCDTFADLLLQEVQAPGSTAGTAAEHMSDAVNAEVKDLWAPFSTSIETEETADAAAGAGGAGAGDDDDGMGDTADDGDAGERDGEGEPGDGEPGDGEEAKPSAAAVTAYRPVSLYDGDGAALGRMDFAVHSAVVKLAAEKRVAQGVARDEASSVAVEGTRLKNPFAAEPPASADVAIPDMCQAALHDLMHVRTGPLNKGGGPPVTDATLPAICRRVLEWMRQWAPRYDAGAHSLSHVTFTKELAFTVAAYFGYLWEVKSCRGPFLLIAPAAYARMWVWVLQWACPNLHTVLYAGHWKDRKKLRTPMQRSGKHMLLGCNILVTTPLAYSKDALYFDSVRFDVVVVQAHFQIVGGRVAQVTRRMWPKLVNQACQQRILLAPATGGDGGRAKRESNTKKQQTPWHMLHYLMPVSFNTCPPDVIKAAHAEVIFQAPPSMTIRARVVATMDKFLVVGPTFVDSLDSLPMLDMTEIVGEEKDVRARIPTNVPKTNKLAMVTTVDGIKVAVSVMGSRLKPVQAAVLPLKPPPSGAPTYWSKEGGNFVAHPSRFLYVSHDADGWHVNVRGAFVGTYAEEAAAGAAAMHALGLESVPLVPKLLVNDWEPVVTFNGQPLPKTTTSTVASASTAVNTLELRRTKAPTASNKKRKAADDDETVPPSKSRRVTDMLDCRLWRARPLLERLESLPAEKLRQLRVLLRASRVDATAICTWCEEPDRKVYLRSLCRRCHSKYYHMGSEVEKAGRDSEEHTALWCGEDPKVAPLGSQGLPKPAGRARARGAAPRTLDDLDVGEDARTRHGAPYPVFGRLMDSRIDIDAAAFALLYNWDGLRFRMQEPMVTLGRVVPAARSPRMFHLGDDPRLPRVAAHLAWRPADQRFVFTVLSAKIETYLNGALLPVNSTVPLNPGTIISMGPLWFVFLPAYRK